MLASADEGIHGLDREGKATFINSAAASMTGYSVEELLGQRLHEILHHTKADGTPYSWEECPAYATLRDGVVRRAADQVFWRKDGSRLPVEYVSAPLREGGAIVGAVVLFRPAPSAGRRGRRSHE